MSEQLQFLCNLLSTCKEILIMSLTDIRKNTNGRLYNILQSRHLSSFRYTGLKNTHFILFAHLPHRQRNTYLRVVTLRARHNLPVWGKHLHQPILYDCFAVTTRYTYNRYIELLPMFGNNELQRHNHIVDTPYISIIVSNATVIWHNKRPHTLLV